MSRRHARLFVKNGHYFLQDLNSTNGTFLNAFNVHQQEPVRIRNGNNIQVGETLMKFYPASGSQTGKEKISVSTPCLSVTGLNEQVLDIPKPPHLNDNN